MIEKLLARFGYAPQRLVDQAHYEGRVDGQAEMQEQCESIVAATRAKYEGVERELDYLRKVIADNVALSHPPLITVRDDGSLRNTPRIS